MLAEEIKGCSVAQAEECAAWLRGQMIDAVRENGGHLASNLGVVELIAMPMWPICLRTRPTQLPRPIPLRPKLPQLPNNPSPCGGARR